MVWPEEKSFQDKLPKSCSKASNSSKIKFHLRRRKNSISNWKPELDVRKQNGNFVQPANESVFFSRKSF